MMRARRPNLRFLLRMAVLLTAAILRPDAVASAEELPLWWIERYAEGGVVLTPDGDPDGDGLTNIEEFRHGTHPLRADTDGDGLTDREEVFVYGTNPLIADTDGGGLSDGDEVALGLNPLDPDDDGYASRTAFTLRLQRGWNLISFPVSPGETAIDRVLAPIQGQYNIVWSFEDGAWKSYDPQLPQMSMLTRLTPGRGYWIDMRSSAALTLTGPPATGGIPLRVGWNLVGFNFAGKIRAASAFEDWSGGISAVWKYSTGIWYMFDPGNPGFSNLQWLDPGYGYWIKSERAGTWHVP